MNKEQLLNELRTHHFPEKIINAFKKVPREDFIPAHKKEFAYENHALPIGYEQTISQPYTIAKMLAMLDLKKGQKVLDDVCHSVAFFDDPPSVVAQFGVINTIVNQLRVIDNAGQRVVDLVSDTAG